MASISQMKKELAKLEAKNKREREARMLKAKLYAAKHPKTTRALNVAGRVAGKVSKAAYKKATAKPKKRKGKVRFADEGFQLF